MGHRCAFLLSLLVFASALTFEELNAESLDSYTLSVKRVLANYRSTTPYIFLNGLGVFFVHESKGINASIPFSPPLFDRLKQVTHPLLASYVLVDPVLRGGGGAISVSLAKNISSYLSLLLEMESSIDSDAILQTNSSYVNAAHVMFNVTSAFLSSVLTNGNVTTEITDSFLKSPEILEAVHVLAYGAANAQLEDLNTAVNQWQTLVDPEQWNEMRVILTLSHMPRRGEAHVQYFAKLLNSNATSGRRIIYAEGFGVNWDGALWLLGEHLLDFDTGRNLFDDDERLHHDLLAPEATEIVDQIFPPHAAFASRRGQGCPMMAMTNKKRRKREELK